MIFFVIVVLCVLVFYKFREGVSNAPCILRNNITSTPATIVESCATCVSARKYWNRTTNMCSDTNVEGTVSTCPASYSTCADCIGAKNFWNSSKMTCQSNSDSGTVSTCANVPANSFTSCAPCIGAGNFWNASLGKCDYMNGAGYTKTC